MEIPIAKAILRFPLTRADMDLLKRASVDADREPFNTPIPAEACWSRVFPNPFSAGSSGSPFATIEYRIPERSRVRVELWSLSGVYLGAVFDGDRDAGIHRAMFDGSALPSGVYRYRVLMTGAIGSNTRMTSGTFVMVK